MKRKKLRNKLSSLSPFSRRLLLMAVDLILLPLAVWLSFWLRLAHPFHSNFIVSGSWLLPLSVLIGLPLFALTGQYRTLSCYVGSEALYPIIRRNGLLVLLLAASGVLFRLPMPPRSSWILLWLFLIGFTAFARFALRDFLINLRSSIHNQQLRVAIYGAGEAGAQLAAALRLAGNHKLVTFLDDNPLYWNRTLNGIPIQPPQVINSSDFIVDQVLLAIPSLSRSERRRIVLDLQNQDISVLQVPSVDDLTSGRARIDLLRKISIEDLLGRDPVEVDPYLLGTVISGKVICVTGAGGSIGSELCRQILHHCPKLLILLEISEPALYTIDQELQVHLPHSASILPVLGSSCDYNLVNRLFEDHNVDVVFHAAAYKHVPLVESNPLAGLSNNAFSSRVVCSAALSAGVKTAVLISTDKAVRPTNVMGASKRLSELIFQASSLEKSNTCFSMVRFGNVLGSSGSVVPLFRRQIASGGPITLTHPEIIRYFMTIPEAAQLVLQSSVFADGGEVFLLDMGQPVRIKDLAEQMVRLSGLTIRDQFNPSGEIEIVCTGLRPGEKLYEELLIDPVSKSTAHPLIFCAQERDLNPDVLWPTLDLLESSIACGDVDTSLSLLLDLVPEWHSGGMDS